MRLYKINGAYWKGRFLKIIDDYHILRPKFPAIQNFVDYSNFRKIYRLISGLQLRKIRFLYNNFTNG